MTLTCPHCGQRVLLRLGVHLSPRRADVFDAIQRQSKYGGIRGDALAAMFGTLNCVRVHIRDINQLLASKGWQIVCEREGSARGFYRLRKRKKDKAVNSVFNRAKDNDNGTKPARQGTELCVPRTSSRIHGEDQLIGRPAQPPPSGRPFLQRR